MCAKFQVDVTSTSSKTLTWTDARTNGATDTQTDGRTDERTHQRRHRPENIMHLYYRRWGIKSSLVLSMQIVNATMSNRKHIFWYFKEWKRFDLKKSNISSFLTEITVFYCNLFNKLYLQLCIKSSIALLLIKSWYESSFYAQIMIVVTTLKFILT